MYPVLKNIFFRLCLYGINISLCLIAAYKAMHVADYGDHWWAFYSFAFVTSTLIWLAMDVSASKNAKTFISGKRITVFFLLFTLLATTWICLVAFNILEMSYRNLILIFSTYSLKEVQNRLLFLKKGEIVTVSIYKNAIFLPVVVKEVSDNFVIEGADKEYIKIKVQEFPVREAQEFFKTILPHGE